jgi:hypothetical protein
MNERIKELMRQSMVEYQFDLRFSPEKFAELLLRECVASIEKTIDTNCETDSEKMGCEFAITDLKEHFGVEDK